MRVTPSMSSDKTREPDEFDAFYKDARERLLVQTYCLTGDLAASRRAVRDAFIVAWHCWRKVSQLDNPESMVRPLAWQFAQRRHTTRVWHREKDIDPFVKATLDALGKLTISQRKAVLLTQLATVSMPEMAREIGLTRERAERELQTGTAQLALTLQAPTPALPTLLEPVAGTVSDQMTQATGSAGWPRATIVRRAGAARRRTHTAVGVAAAVGALLVSGSLVTDAAGVRPTLERGPASTTEEGAMGGDVTAPLPEASLVTARQLDDARSDRDWTVKSTDDNSDGSGRVVPCQLDRYADPRGDAALVRRFSASAGARQSPASATQLTEISPSLRAAKRAFRTSVTWYAACADERVQLLSTWIPVDVGDESVELVLRSWDHPVETYVIGVARSGRYTTTTFLEERTEKAPDRKASAVVLSAAVDGLCDLEAGGSCGAQKPELVKRAPVPVGMVPALISELDLPPVRNVALPWVGTEPRRPQRDLSVTPCARAGFTRPVGGIDLSNSATRSFLIPEAALPAEFGLTETVGSLPEKRAQSFVEDLRARMVRCPDKDLGTEVKRVARSDDRATTMTVWRLDVQVTDQRTVHYWMAILRSGTAVGQLGFLPSSRANLPEGDVVDLAKRALARLDELPEPDPS